VIPGQPFQRRNREEEGRSAPDFALHPNTPTVCLDDPFRDRKPEAGA
jgi:hypothetical protein